MTARWFVCALLLLGILSAASCAVKKERVPSLDVSERWAIVDGEKPGQNYVLIKNSHDLELALRHMGCKEKKPCSVGRLGELYVIVTPKTSTDSPRRQENP
jgi:hypothetical protein